MATIYKILVLCVGFALSCNLWAQSRDSSCGRDIILDFGERIGINVDSIPHKIDKLSDNGLLLDLNLRKKLLTNIVPEQYVADSNYSAYICAIRQISDSIIMVQYALAGFDYEALFLATYSCDSILKDSMYLGHSWDFGDAEIIDNDKGIERIYNTTTKCDFLSHNSFLITLTTRQFEKEYTLEKETELYLFTEATQYRVSEYGLFEVISTEVKEEGYFAGWEDDPFYDDIVELIRIDKLPQSTQNKYYLYGELGEKVGEAEDFVLDSIYDFAYAVSPDKFLNWIYNNREKDVTIFLNALYDKYEKFEWANDSIRIRILSMADFDKKTYFQNLLDLWDKGGNKDEE
ncbi:MAG: hypothetical protein OSJ56_12220 [Prevotella sp.]|uniref:hypothetical protein n=1 Tax=uncultured Phocaeicola sp. TaxID=990718 RepID=UPI002605E7C2|nr:hypothetical protein [uncultured Phocaeicola sp.]MCX4294807.1 hypothetical protein [Prevotella sp.]